MIDPDKRNAVFTLHQEGMSAREIGQRLQISRSTVASIIRQQGAVVVKPRQGKIEVDLELLRRLHHECDGWVQRIHERLSEEHKVSIGYSTLTRLLRQHGLGVTDNRRCQQVADVPGEEMQHDTSVYQVKLGGQSARVIASMLYLRYSKRRYLKFYRSFHRFAMKCFLHEALMFWGYAARKCVIDNTNLARWKGTGKQAVIVPEMESFGRAYGFQFFCHAIGHSNRKAGEERSFWTLETNFLPGRLFASLEDLNQQARQWATERLEHRPVGKAKLIPAQAFEHERGYLKELTPHICPPYQAEERTIDQYGYVAFEGNYYWVPDRRGEGETEANAESAANPGSTNPKSVKVLRYADRLKLCLRNEVLVEYPLPAEDVRNQKFSPPGEPAPRHGPKNRKQDSRVEELRLCALGPDVVAYLEFARNKPGVQRHRFARQLFLLSAKLVASVFLETVRRALRYRVTDFVVLDRIAWQCMTRGTERIPDVDFDEHYRDRPTYLAGHLTDPPDLSAYDVVDEPSPPAEPTSQEEPRDNSTLDDEGEASHG